MEMELARLFRPIYHFRFPVPDPESVSELPDRIRRNFFWILKLNP